MIKKFYMGCLWDTYRPIQLWGVLGAGAPVSAQNVQVLCFESLRLDMHHLQPHFPNTRRNYQAWQEHYPSSMVRALSTSICDQGRHLKAQAEFERT